MASLTVRASLFASAAALTLAAACTNAPTIEGNGAGDASQPDDSPGSRGTRGDDGVGDDGAGDALDVGGALDREEALIDSASDSTSEWIGVEQCDGLDNDQNGEVDELCACTPGDEQPCFAGDPDLANVGVCALGVQRCELTGSGEFAAGRWSACDGYGAPDASDSCNGRDDDCDGTADEGCACDTGDARFCSTACGEGTQRCEGDTWGSCDAPQAESESCNGVDDDCDGAVDEALTRPCSEGCGIGTQSCVDGAWSACEEASEAPEQCNGVDDDCDGETDEGLVRACSSLCGAGSERCDDGAWGGCSAPSPTAEACGNGDDDDCDGLADCSDGDCAGSAECKPACDPYSAAESATPLPLDLYVMLDCSGSMDEACTWWDTKWECATDALSAFFNSSESAGDRAALQFFPRSGYSCGGDGGVSASPGVGLTALPANAARLDDELEAWGPGGYTPTESAIRGLVSYTDEAATPGRVMVGLLITDGMPTECNTDAYDLAWLLELHEWATGIKTYVVGMEGADYDVLEIIAAGGGAPAHSDFCRPGDAPCHYFDVGTGDPEAFQAALDAIRFSAVACSFAAPPSGTDYDAVDVLYRSAGGAADDIDRVADASDCGAVSGGWYFDDPDAPTRIELCPATCADVQADPQAEISVEAECD